ncbi:unnamed protein product [marine sediment metagenome]|uniref:Uncharacterized protein n=1 Tax=marine sediment metagenome TaxID=412755 RepID=X1EZG4_9ZZZZ
MLVQFGGGILDARGSIGGQTASRNRFGNYFRARVTPVNPGTNRQDTVRSAVAQLAARWKSDLTQDHRDAWEVYAANIVRHNKLGGQIRLTGFNHFIRGNVPRVQSGEGIVDAGPVDLTIPGQDPSMACVVDEGGQAISVAFDNGLPWADQDDGVMLVYMSLPHNDSVNFIGGPYRYADKILGKNGDPPASPNPVACPFICAEGQQVKIRCTISEENGRLSDPFLHQSAVTA